MIASGRRVTGSALVMIGALVVLFGSTGCGVMAAITNPKAAWAVTESTPLSVVVRRAEAAHATADQVQRLVGDTGVDENSAWLDKTSLKKEDAQALMTEAGGDSVYGGTPTRVVQAEAWAQALSAICSEETGYPNLLAALGPDVGKLYSEIAAQEKTLAKLHAEKDAEEKALDAKNISASDKAEHEKQRDALKKQISDTEDAYKPKVEALLKAVKAGGAKAPAAMKDKLRTAIANLRAAVSDAKNANSAAMLRYPIAVTGLPGDIQKAAPRFVADVIEEKTGTRPDTNGIKPDVKLDGFDVKLSINGVPAEKLGSLSMGDLISGTTGRMTSYVKRSLTLVAYADETQQLLSFEADLLDAYLDGLGGNAKGADLSDLKVQAKAPGAPAAAASNTAQPAKKGPRSIAGLALSAACKNSKKPEQVVADAKPTPAKTESKASASVAANDKSSAAKTSAPSMPKAAPEPRTASTKSGATVAAKASARATDDTSNKPGEAKAEVFIFSSYSPSKAAAPTTDAPAKPAAVRAPAKRPAAAPTDCAVEMERDGKKICL